MNCSVKNCCNRQNNRSSDLNLDGVNSQHLTSRIGMATKIENSNSKANACGTCSVSGPFTQADATEPSLDEQVLDDPSYKWDNGIEEDGNWQQYWTELTALSSTFYHVSLSKVGWRFLNTYSKLIGGCVERKWNRKKFLLFPIVVLQKLKGTNNFHNIRQRIDHCLDLWDRREYAQLVEDTLSTIHRQMPAKQ
eukprot:2491767-Ditylum_brightwellii.AAC.1